MATKTEAFNQNQLKNNLPDIRPGDSVEVHQKISAQDGPASGGKKTRKGEKSQVFGGLVIARKHGKGISSTITVRKVISGVGVERVFPLHSPAIEKIKITKRSKVKKAKLYYLRRAGGKKTRLKIKEFTEAIALPEEPVLAESTPAPEEKTEQKSE